MDKRISIKTIYLLLVISFGLIGLGVGSTYAVFTARAEIDNPIVINSNLTHDSETLETIEIEVPAKEVITSTLNITNTSGKTLNYSIWYIDEGSDIDFIDSSPSGTISNQNTNSIALNIINKEDKDVIVRVRISSSTDSIVLGKDMKLINGDLAYALYSESDNSLTFYRSSTPIVVGDVYNNKSVTKVYTGFELSSYEVETDIPWYDIRKNVRKVIFEDTIYSISTAYWFYEFVNCSELNLTKLHTTSITDMHFMFFHTGYNTNTFKLLGLDDWDTSKVTNMESLFNNTGHSSTTFSLNLSKWNTSSVINMQNLFNYTGYSATEWTIGDLSNWNISNVTTMQATFESIGNSSSSAITLDLSSWNTSKVTNMDYMFCDSKNIKTIYVSDKWNIDAVTSSIKMFRGCTSLVGGAGTIYNSNFIDKTYARIDGGTSSPGYLTLGTTG